jgi:hypothetical protein
MFTLMKGFSLAAVVVLALGGQACSLRGRTPPAAECGPGLTKEEVLRIAHGALQAAWGDSSLTGFREEVIEQGCDYVFVAAWEGTEAIEDIVIPIDRSGRITTLPYCCYVGDCPDFCPTPPRERV